MELRRAFIFPETLAPGDLGTSSLRAGPIPVVPPDVSLTVRAGAEPILLFSGNEGGSKAFGDGGLDKPFAVLSCAIGSGPIQAR